jgi:GTP-binding protein EngB required for normal cell division
MTDKPQISPNDWLSVDDVKSKQFVDQWTAAGLSKYVSLPMICVLGDTSSGKSSVLSSLIGIELPSGSTLTTKCPILIQLTKGARDEATIDIQWYKDHSRSKDSDTIGNNSDSIRQRKRIIEKQVEEMHRVSVDNAHVDEMKDDHVSVPVSPLSSPTSQQPPNWTTRRIKSDLSTQVPQILKEAQQVILNHRTSELITPDVIRLSVQLINADRELTLIDLPGLVAYQHKHETSLMSRVERVVLDYVHNPRSILVPVVVAPTNIHNSKVLQWCRTVDPTTTRTIPVLTKPDLIDPGSESDVVTLLQESHFAHGFYMVKNRGQASLDGGASIADGLTDEDTYFANTSPWNAVQSPHRRLGIPALRYTLATVLLHVIKEALPDILGDIEEQFQTIDAAIDAWGEMLLSHIEQRKFYHSVTQRLIANVAANLSGKGTIRRNGTISSKPGGAARLHSACNTFMKQIQNGSLATISQLQEGVPVVVSTTNSTSEDVRGEIVHMDLELGFVCVDCVDVKDHTTDILFDAVGYTTENPDFDKDEVWSDGHRVFIGREAGSFDSLRKLPLNHVRTDSAWLIDKIADYRTDDLACFINVEMFRNIVGEFVHDDWTPPCLELLKTLESILNDALDVALQEIFQQETMRYPLLRSMVEERCRSVCSKLVKGSTQDVKIHLEMEEHHPYTQDEVLLQTLSDSRYQNLRRDLEIQLKLTQEGVVFDTQAIKTILDTVFNKHKRLHWMAEQMELVLSSYGKVATQRVLDRTPQICWQACRKLPGLLQESLGSVTDDILEKCLWESPESKEKYQDMVMTLKDLQEAREVVKKIQ